MNIQMNAATKKFLSLIKVFSQSRFMNIGDRENDFQRMSSAVNEKYSMPLSDKFILDIQDALDIQHALENNTTIHDHLRLMFDDGKYLNKADQLNWELKHTPVIFEHHQPVILTSGYREELEPVFDHYKIRIPASDMPPDALPYGTKTLAEVPYGCVVCFLESSYLFDSNLPVLDISFPIDRDIVKALHKISKSENLEEDNTTSSRQRPQKTVESNTQQQQMTPEEKVYNFIAQNSPVTTKTLLAQEFGCKERRLYDILQSLLKEKKITNPKYGVYKSTNH